VYDVAVVVVVLGKEKERRGGGGEREGGGGGRGPTGTNKVRGKIKGFFMGKDT